MTDQGTAPPEVLDLAAIRALLDEGQQYEMGSLTERFWLRDVVDRVPALLAALDAAHAEAERLRAFAEAVLALHRRNRPEDGGCLGWTPDGYGYLDDWCVECSEQSGREYGTPWPCRTAALAWDAEGRPLIHATPTRQETSDV